ncbi:MAG: hypothetical protein OXT06_29090, partial [Rhodospirillaceae bacterium]|nr:hypothetical protein [Rhodospirillaceae bacterium]
SNEALADALINQFGPGGSQNDGLSVSDLQAILQDLQNLPLSTPTGPLDPASAGLQSDVGQDPAQIGGGACPAGQVLSCSPGFGCSCI